MRIWQVRGMSQRIGASGKMAALVRFLIVGGLTAALYVGLLAVIVEAAGRPPALGAAIAYLLAVVFNYCAHYAWTYRTDRPHRSTGPRFFFVVVAVFSINVLATAWLPPLLGIDYVTVQIGLVVITASVTFIAQYRWVFSRMT